MRKADLKLLESVFEKTEEHKLPAQFAKNNKRILDLEARGLVERWVFTMPGHIPAKIVGWNLTDAGRVELSASNIQES